MKPLQKIKVCLVIVTALLLTGMTTWSGEHKDHRHGLSGPHFKGNSRPFSRPTRYTGHRHGVWSHEVKGSYTGSFTSEEETVNRPVKSRRKFGHHKHGVWSH